MTKIGTKTHYYGNPTVMTWLTEYLSDGQWIEEMMCGRVLL